MNKNKLTKIKNKIGSRYNKIIYLKTLLED